MNGEVNIKDATLIQKSVAGAESIKDAVAILAADADQNKEINIKDATIIQKFIARMAVSTPIGELINI